MSEASHRHSAQSKARISSSLRQLWAKRLKGKRSAEKFYSSWAESIAEAARRGGINEEELNWDSYQTLKEEIASRQLQHAAEKAKEKKMKKIHLPTSKQRGTSSGRTRDEKLKLATLRELNNRKARLRKIHEKKVRGGTFGNQAGAMFYLQYALERLDIESIKKEQWQSIVSLADQIQAAKRKRTQAITNESTIRTSLGS